MERDIDAIESDIDDMQKDIATTETKINALLGLHVSLIVVLIVLGVVGYTFIYRKVNTVQESVISKGVETAAGAYDWLKNFVTSPQGQAVARQGAQKLGFVDTIKKKSKGKKSTGEK